MRSIIRDLLQRLFGRQSEYRVFITYEYTCATDILETSNRIKALDEYNAIRAALLFDRNDEFGPEQGWRQVHVKVKFLGYI